MNLPDGHPTVFCNVPPSPPMLTVLFTVVPKEYSPALAAPFEKARPKTESTTASNAVAKTPVDLVDRVLDRGCTKATTRSKNNLMRLLGIANARNSFCRFSVKRDIAIPHPLGRMLAETQHS
jgi:hypothetical protein